MEQKRIEELITNEFNIIQGSSNVTINGISTDSRTVSRGELFIALKGEKYDGHQFIEDAVKKGASCVLTDKNYEIPEWLHRHEDITVLSIFDTLFGLGEIARRYREGFKIPSVGITGSNGKTSTKDMLAGILSEKDIVTKTLGNFNNLIGLPLTLFRVQYETGFIVAEMGMSQIGEIKRLTQILNPEIGIITNIGETHLEYLGSIENVARGKKEIVDEMSSKGTIVINADDIFAEELIKDFKGKIVTFGINNDDADFTVRDIVLGKDYTKFNYNGKTIKINITGHHFVYNALAAIAAAKELGCTEQEIADGLTKTELSHMRMELIAARDCMFINDTYNANPRSVRAAMKTLIDLPLEGRKILLLGDMLELGSKCIELHENIGKEIDKEKIDILITFGELAKFIGDGAAKAGFQKNNIYNFNDKEQCAEFLKCNLKSGDNILVKGSRGMKMEEIISNITRED